MTLQRKYVLVTGVSSGIGNSIVSGLLSHGYYVFGSVRNSEDAQKLQTKFGGHFLPLIFDVTNEKQIIEAQEKVNKIIGNGRLFGLINNAGISVSGPLMHVPLSEFKQQFEVNVFGLLRVTQIFLPLLGADKNTNFPPGKIINISSVSGRIASPFVGPYAASKHAVEALSDSLRRECLPYGIEVVVFQPGNVNTPIWDKISSMEKYGHTDYGPVLEKLVQYVRNSLKNAFPVEKVSKKIVRALSTKKPKTRYPIPNKYITRWLLPRFLPDRLVDYLISVVINMKKRKFLKM